MSEQQYVLMKVGIKSGDEQVLALSDNPKDLYRHLHKSHRNQNVDIDKMFLNYVAWMEVGRNRTHVFFVQESNIKILSED